jgi:hypothetical protein
MMVTLKEHPEISILNPQMRYFQKKWGLLFVQKWSFWMTVRPRKLSLNKIGVMDLSYIMNSGQNSLCTTFPNIFHYYRPIRPIYQQIKKIWNSSHRLATGVHQHGTTQLHATSRNSTQPRQTPRQVPRNFTQLHSTPRNSRLTKNHQEAQSEQNWVFSVCLGFCTFCKHFI